MVVALTGLRAVSAPPIAPTLLGLGHPPAAAIVLLGGSPLPGARLDSV